MQRCPGGGRCPRGCWGTVCIKGGAGAAFAAADSFPAKFCTQHPGEAAGCPGVLSPAGIWILAQSSPTCVTLGQSFFFVCFCFFLNLFIYLMAVLGLRFCARAFSSCGKRGPLFIAVRGPRTIAASLVAEHRLQTRKLSNCGSRA